MWMTTAIDWVELLVRWTHIIAAICWIGSSFYFMALDASLKPNARLDARVKGEAWQVHGGGFYNMQKFTVAPEFMPEELTWFKWEAYATFIFGFLLLVLTYYVNPSLYLIDPAVADIKPWDAVAIGVGSIVFGWLIYDFLCNSWVGKDGTRLAIVCFILMMAVTFFYSRVFSGRGAFIQTGALIGSIMVGNVLLVIIPNQQKVVKALLAGEVPDPALGAAGKHRSSQNNYVTLPVLFTMISNHYPFVYSSRWNWLVLSAVFIGGFLIRHWFNIKHTGAKPSWWLWPAGAVPIALAALLTILVQPRPAAGTSNVAFADIQAIVGQRCHVCHSAHPVYPGIAEAPKGVMFDTPAQIALRAPQIYAQAVATQAMPLGNVTGITEEERAALGGWISAGAKTK